MSTEHYIEPWKFLSCFILNDQLQGLFLSKFDLLFTVLSQNYEISAITSVRYIGTCYEN